MASSAICRLVLALIEADKFPPKHAAGKNNQNVNGHQYKVDAVKPRSFKVALALIDRAWSAGVFGDSPHKVREDCKTDCNHHRRGACADRNHRERNVHGCNMA